MKTEIDWQQLLDQVVSGALTLGKSILIALVIYFVGRYLIKLVNNLIQRAMEKRKVDGAVRSFVGSLVNILLLILLFLSIVGALGIEMTSFAALLASAGVAVGMALSRSEERRVGKECHSVCRSRWSPYH